MNSTTNFTRIFDIPYYQKSRFPKKISLSIVRDKVNIRIGTEDLISQINKLSTGLLKKGFRKGERIGIMSHHGSPEWNIVDFACQQIGLVVVPLHHNYDADDLKHILNEVELSACFVSRVDWKEKLVKTGSIRFPIYTFRKMENEVFWQELLEEETTDLKDKVQTIKANINPSDIATIVYTSGATGLPKGVMLSHNNICCNIKSIITLIPLNYKSVTASFLPLSHIFERMVIYTYLAVGAEVHYVLDQKKILDELQKIKPNYITSVPRVLEKIYDHILFEQQNAKVFKRLIIAWSMKVGIAYSEDHRGIRKKLSLLIADLLVFRKWRKVLGGRIEGIVVGAAPMRKDISAVFSAAKIPIREGYGLTETSPAVSFNRFEPGGFRLGTVGIPIPGVEVRISQEDFGSSSILLEDDEGEIWVKGPNVMQGYYKKEKETNARITEEGWFKTGDIGKFVHKRFLVITDRKKDIFKTTSGRYIAPNKIEQRLLTSTFIDQCMVTGMGESFVVALVVPDFKALEKWCNTHEIHWTAPLYMLVNHKIEQLFKDEIEKCNQRLKPYEMVQGYSLLSEPWTTESGEYTPTLKLRRHFIEEKFKEKLAFIYKNA